MASVHNHAYRHTRGIALLIALLFVAVFGGILAAMSAYLNPRTFEGEAEAAGWEAVVISKAARLYVRDKMMEASEETPPRDLRVEAATPDPISIDVLKTEGYLPQNFGRKNGSGVYINALDQPIRVIMGNWSTRGLGLTPDDANVPSAFVLFEASANSKGSYGLSVKVSEGARKNGAAVGAPLLDNSNNIVSRCTRTSPAVNTQAAAIWDTGCMTVTEFASLTGRNFAPGDFIMPAWKAKRVDQRAIMRFPQPDNDGYSTMLTDLQMGTPTAGVVQVPMINGAQENTDIPLVESDTSTAVTGDKRFNIMNVSALSAVRVIAEPQTIDNGTEPLPAARIADANNESLNITGNITLGSDLQVHNTRSLPGGVTDRLNIPNAILAVDRNIRVNSTGAGRSTARITNAAIARTLKSDALNAGAFDSQLVSGYNSTVQGQIVSDNVTAREVWGSNLDWTTGTLNAPNGTLRMSETGNATDQVRVIGTTTMNAGELQFNDTATVTRAGPIGTLRSSANTTVNGRISGTTTGTIPVLNITGECLDGAKITGGCPNRKYIEPNITP